MANAGFEWDILTLQEVAIRSQEETWKYDMKEYDGMQFHWNKVAPWDTLIAIGKQLATRMTMARTRSSRHAIILTAAVDAVTLMTVNAHMPTSWATTRRR